jgi:hypothetical protein
MSLYLERLEKGRDATPRSWLYENKASEEVLQSWLQILSSLKDGGPDFEKIYQFDTSQIQKWGPMGKIPPIDQAIETLTEQYEVSAFDKWEPLFPENQLEEIASEIAPQYIRRLRPLSFKAVIDDMRDRDTLTTNSGYPDFGRRSKPEILQKAIQDAESKRAYEYPAIVLFRSYYGKLRPVWMYPMAMNLIENSFAQAIQRVLPESQNKLTSDYVTPWKGFEDVKLVFTQQWNELHTAFGGDTTAMDAHFRLSQMATVYHCVKHWFQQEHWPELERCMRHVNEIDLLVGKTKMLAGAHGISSGSGWTQLSETIFQLILFYSWKLNRSRKEKSSRWDVSPGSGQGIGDDLVWFFHRPVATEAVTTRFENVGLPANPKKQSNEPNSCTFLQRLFLTKYPSRENPAVLGGIYPTVRALNSSIHPERFHDPEKWNSDMFCIRQYMILENTVDHPLFEEFVTFVVRGQRDLIPFAKKTDSELSAIAKESRSLPGLVATYNQEKREKPLSSFESIKFVRERL